MKANSAASKYALEALCDVLRVELAPFGVRVVVVEPGPIKSEFTERAMSTLRLDGPALEAYEALFSKRDEIRRKFDSASVGPEVVAKATERAVTARRPRSRYVVPFRARLVLSASRLPAAWVDAIVSRTAGIPPRL